jgi:hypothetical protein
MKIKKLMFRIKRKIEERRINTKARGPHAEQLVRIKLYENHWLPANGPEESLIDVFAVAENFPLRVAVIQVKSLYVENDAIHIKNSYLLEDSGPTYVIVVEATERGKYTYLVLSHSEMKSEMLKYGRRYKKETYLTIPKDLVRYEWCKEKWEKVGKYSRVFGRELEPQTM